MGKTVKPNQAYEVWTNGDWTWRVLKFYKSQDATIRDEYGRVFCEVDGFEREMGDVYYSEVTRGHYLLDTNYPEGHDSPFEVYDGVM